MIIDVSHTWDGRPLARPAARLVVKPGPVHWIVQVEADYHGDPPPDGPPGPTSGLWEHEVVELFLVDGERYTEIELGPHGHHLVLQLHGVRRVVCDRLPLDYQASIDGARWRGLARIDAALLPLRAETDRPATFNAYAIHGRGADRRYLAACPVPGDAPDFHRLTAFPAWPPR